MIYAVSLGNPLKKVYGDKCYITNIPKIVEQLKLDAAITGMDVCVLGPQDVIGINRVKVAAAVNTKHPSVCVIYIYSKDKDADILNTPMKKLVKKITADSLKEVVDGYIDEHSMEARKSVVSRDAKVNKVIESRPSDVMVSSESMKGGLFKRKQPKPESTKDEPALLYDSTLELYYYLDPIGQMVYVDKDTMRTLSPAEIQRQKDIIAARNIEDEEDIPVNLPEPEPTPEVESSPAIATETVPERTKRTFEENIQNVSNFHDWGLLKEALSKDVAVRELLEENANYQGVVQMLNVLDQKITNIYRDAGLTSEQKFEKILEVGSQRSTLMATKNDMISKKVIDIIEAVTISARRTVDSVLEEHEDAMSQLAVADKSILDEENLMKLIDERTNAVVELLALTKGIVQIYQAMDAEVHNVIMEMDKNLPSDNSFINSIVGSASQVLTPTNTKELAHLLMRTLQSKREAFSVLQDSVDGVIDGIHNLLKRDEEIIQYQQHMISVLKAHRIEDVVVLDTVLKSVLHVYVGDTNTGRTATTLTWSGCLSRRHNTLLVDLTGNNKLRSYGVEPISLDDFLLERVTKQLCVVEGTINDIENIYDFIHEIKTRLDYYAYVNVVLDSSQIELMNVLCKEALSVNYITNCTTESIASVKTVYGATEESNIAHKVIMIDPPVDVLKIAKLTGCDVTRTKCVVIPQLRKTKMCALTGEAPYEYREVRTAFEESFR